MTTEILNTLESAKKPVHMNELAQKLGVSDREIRKGVQTIREDGLTDGKLLIASKDGYYLSDNPKEIEVWKKKTISSALTQLKQVSKAKKFLTRQEKSMLKNLFSN